MFVSLTLMWNCHILKSEGSLLTSLRNITYKCTKHCHTSVIVWQNCMLCNIIDEASTDKVRQMSLLLTCVWEVPGLILAWDASNSDTFHSSS